MRDAVRAVLAGEGYDVTDVADGAGALAEIARERPDVLVLDLHMPVMDGAAVLAALRADLAAAYLPVIVMTADGEEGRKAAEGLGADEYVTKPFDPAALLQTMARVMGEDDSPAG